MFGAETLWALSTGGSDVAADPESQSHGVVGPQPPGVTEACAWMREVLADAVGPPRFLFLVGGPGGGKSLAAASLVAGLASADDTDNGLVRRTYTYNLGGRDLILVNDATIDAATPGADSETGGLSYDIGRAAESRCHLIACVNRGVLSDEIAGHSVPHEILVWLALEDGTAADGAGAFLRQRMMNLPGGGRAHVTAVYVDVCSLLEAKPETSVAPDGELRPSAYQLMPLNGDRTDTPAGVVVRDVVEQFRWDSQADASIDPVRANIDSLRHIGVVKGLLQLMRAGEIVSGQRFTYRELWGALARLIVGELPRLVRAVDADAHLAESASGNGDASFKQLQLLASHRWFVSLFGGLDPAPGLVSSDPVLGITATADPLFDASPRWVGPVIDAFTSSVLTSTPLTEVRAALPDEAGGVVQPFDETLDRAFAEYCRGSASHSDRAAAELWYGRYLTRLYAAAAGVPAFRDAVEEWLLNHRQAPAVSDRLAPLLRTLLSPRRFARSQDASPLVPLYASRTDPILGYVENPTLAMRAAPFQFETRREGEDLRLAVKEDGEGVGEVLLDFDLVREALACSQDWLGMTEASEHTSPRVERFRSRRLTSGALSRNPQVAVAVGDQDFLVSVDRTAHD